MDALKPVREIARIGESGQPLNQPCQHWEDWEAAPGDPVRRALVIPGLDADFCKVCRVYWVDLEVRSQMRGGQK